MSERRYLAAMLTALALVVGVLTFMVLGPRRQDVRCVLLGQHPLSAEDVKALHLPASEEARALECAASAESGTGRSQ